MDYHYRVESHLELDYLSFFLVIALNFNTIFGFDWVQNIGIEQTEVYRQVMEKWVITFRIFN